MEDAAWEWVASRPPKVGLLSHSMAHNGILNAFYVLLFLEISAAMILCENSLELSAAAIPAMKDAG